METSGPSAARAVMGPLRRLFVGKELPRPAARGRFISYALPLGLLALIGLGAAAGQYLLGNRHSLVPVAVWALAVGTVLPAAAAYRRPVLAWRLAFVMMFLGTVNWVPKEPWPWNPVQIFVFLFVLARLAVVSRESWQTFWAAALSVGTVFLYAPPSSAWGAAVLLVAIASIGDIFARRRRTGELVAEQNELTELERARRAVLEERTRIAREMHDVVAHHMSMIAVRAETAPFRVPGMTEETHAEMATIASAAREALTDMRRLLGVLRSEKEENLTAPQPGLADVGILVGTARAAGLDVAVELGGLTGVPPTVGLAAYRIVQEALANVARHAPDGPVTVRARGSSDRVVLLVSNPLPLQPRGGGSGGHGLAGMHERAALLGGTLSAGPVGGEFVVSAILPIGDGRAGDERDGE
ncbi:sensor histidine kinase [Actinoplanes sp. NPDC051343]|uniref:sensor histidine kinase n=1 Tax=Actinoplanes sp. NPDC051343 TaxID=3363906 RepID=UPI0037A01C0E